MIITVIYCHIHTISIFLEILRFLHSLKPFSSPNPLPPPYPPLSPIVFLALLSRETSAHRPPSQGKEDMVVVVVILGDDSLCPFQTSEPPPSIPRITRASSSSVGREAGGGGGRETVGSWWTLQRETVSPSLSPGARKGESSSRARGAGRLSIKSPVFLQQGISHLRLFQLFTMRAFIVVSIASDIVSNDFS